MGAERLRISERGFDREMILERDFALHPSPSNPKSLPLFGIIH